MTDFSELSAGDAVTLMREGSLTAEQYAAALLARAAAAKPLNAFLALDHDWVLAQARAADQRRARNEPLGELTPISPPA